MKLNVVETLKGRLSISFLPGSYKAGDLVELTVEQLEFAETQGLVNAGLLLIDKSEVSKSDKKKIKESMIEFSNESKGILVFSWGLTVRPAQRFFLPKKHAESFEFLQYVRSGKVLAIEKDGEVKKEETPKAQKTEKKPKTIKRIGSGQELEATKNGNAYVVNPNGEDLTNKANPKGTYVHNPNKGKVPSSIDEQIAEIDRENDGGLEFVDQKQAKERLIQTKKSIESRRGI